jgi:hypothetical protein
MKPEKSQLAVKDSMVFVYVKSYFLQTSAVININKDHSMIVGQQKKCSNRFFQLRHRVLHEKHVFGCG